MAKPVPGVLDDGEREQVETTFGVDSEQVARDHVISHALAAISSVSVSSASAAADPHPITTRACRNRSEMSATLRRIRGSSGWVVHCGGPTLAPNLSIQTTDGHALVRSADEYQRLSSGDSVVLPRNFRASGVHLVADRDEPLTLLMFPGEAIALRPKRCAVLAVGRVGRG